MPEILDEYEFHKTEYRKYDWAEWMDGKTRLFKKGVDYTTLSKNFRTYAHKQAQMHNLICDCNVIGGGEKVVLRFRKRPVVQS